MHELPQEVVGRAGGGRPPRRAMFLAALALLCCAGAFPAAAASLPGAGGVRLDAALVPAADVWAEYALLQGVADVIHPKPGGAVNEDALGRAVESVVNRALLVGESSRRGRVLGDADLAAARAREVESWRGEANFASALAMLKIPEEYLLRRSAQNRLVNAMVEGEIGGASGMPETAVREFYDTNLRGYLNPEPPLRYLLLPPAASYEDVRAVAVEAERLARESRDYSGLVRRFSVHAGAAAGGVVAPGGEPPHFKEVGKLKPGRLSREMPDAAGVHIYVRDPSLPLPFDQVRERVRADAQRRRVQAQMKALVTRLRAATKIEYLAGEVPVSSPGTGSGHHGK